MLRYLALRLIGLIPVVLGATVVVFMIMSLVPGDPIDIMFHGMPRPTGEQRAAIERELGLDRSLPAQYAQFLGSALQGDLGRSIRTRRPVMQELQARVPNTIKLTLGGLLLAAVFGTVAGVLSAVYRGTWIDAFSMTGAVLALSIPSFWLGLMLILLFSVQLGWFPAVGADGWRALVLPSITLGALGGSIIARMTRSTLLEVLREHYVRTARAKGLVERLVLVKHALRNAMIPLVTIIGLQAGSLLSGAFVVEAVFAYPGIGHLGVQAILSRDIPLVQGTILVTAIVYALVNLLVDLAYSVLDPRIRYGS